MYNFFINCFCIFFLISISMFYNYSSYLFEWSVFSFNSINMEIYFILDWISCIFISVVSLISSMIMLYWISYMDDEIYSDRFSMILILFVCFMYLMVSSPNWMG